MKIEEILRNKGHDVVTITESQSVLDAARVLVDRNIGGLVVTEGERPTGILPSATSCVSRHGPRVSSARPGSAA